MSFDVSILLLKPPSFKREWTALYTSIQQTRARNLKLNAAVCAAHVCNKSRAFQLRLNSLEGRYANSNRKIDDAFSCDFYYATFIKMIV